MLLYFLMLGFSLTFAVYGFWYLFIARTFQPLTLDDLALMWRLHKQQTGCTASRVHSLLSRNNEIVGFKCECGYEFLQRRLRNQRVLKPQVSSGYSESSRSSKNSARKLAEKH
jgi:hypothetical protein